MNVSIDSNDDIRFSIIFLGVDLVGLISLIIVVSMYSSRFIKVIVIGIGKVIIVEGEAQKIAFNYKYLIDFLKNC